MSTTVSTLSEMLRRLEYGEGYGGYAQLFKSLRIPLSELESSLECGNNHYKRKLLQRTGSYELLLMCWQNEQTSPIHSYAGQQGWIYVAQGSLAIDYYLRRDSDDTMERYKTVEIGSGDYGYLNDYIGFHRIRHIGNQRAVSLHLHAGPVEEWEVFDPETGTYSHMAPGPHTDR